MYELLRPLKLLLKCESRGTKPAAASEQQEKRLWYVASSRPPFRFHSFKLVLRRQQIYFQFLCGAGKTALWLLHERRVSACSDGRAALFSGEFAGWFSGTDKKLKQQKSACGPLRLMQPESPPGKVEKRTVEWNVLSLWERSLCLCHDLTVTHTPVTHTPALLQVCKRADVSISSQS